MMDQDHDPLPDELAVRLPEAAERDALDAVWQALPAARPRPAVAHSERNAMWAAIAAATSASDASAPAPSAHAPSAAAPSAAAPSAAAPSASAPSASAPSVSVHASRSVPRPPAPAGRRPAWATRHRRSLAALAALLLVTTAAVGRPGAWLDVRAPRGDARTLLLPDSTRVVLDADSRLRYRAGFRGWFGRAATREVQLAGSGYFDVRRDGRAFVVTTYNANVRVLGTAFSVDAWEADRTGTAVHVAEGRVAVRGAAAGESTLQAGERAVVSHAAATAGPAAPVAIAQVAPWRNGGFAAIDEPLGAVLPAIARRYDVAVQVTDSAVMARRLTLYVPEADAERLLGDIATMQGLVLERRRDGYLLRSP